MISHSGSSGQPPVARWSLRLGWRIVLSLIAFPPVALLLLRAGAQPVVPAVVTYQPNYHGNALVATFHNTREHFVAVRAVFSNAALNQKRSAVLNIGPYQSVEVGEQQGWRFMTG